MVARDRNGMEYPKPKEDVYVLWVEGVGNYLVSRSSEEKCPGR